MPTFGLIGYPLGHSFSRRYFTDKFQKLGLGDTHRYLNFALSDLAALPVTLAAHPDLAGCNVTIPYKRKVLDYLDSIDPVAARIGAVNTIAITPDGLRGYNTDYLGFRDDLLHHRREQGYRQPLAGTYALVLGTGGAALAVLEAFRSLGVLTTLVSRSAGPNQLTYGDLSEAVLHQHLTVVNTTPLGTFPEVDACPDLPYDFLTPAHFAYDLVYNPAETAFLRRASRAGAGTANGLGMLYRQAEAAWKIWTEE